MPVRRAYSNTLLKVASIMSPLMMSPFQILSDKKQFVQWRPGEKFNEDCVINDVKHQSSVVSYKGQGRFTLCTGSNPTGSIRTNKTYYSSNWKLNECFPNSEVKVGFSSLPYCKMCKNISCPKRNNFSCLARKFPGSRPNKE